MMKRHFNSDFDHFFDANHHNSIRQGHQLIFRDAAFGLEVCKTGPKPKPKTERTGPIGFGPVSVLTCSVSVRSRFSKINFGSVRSGFISIVFGPVRFRSRFFRFGFGPQNYKNKTECKFNINCLLFWLSHQMEPI